MTNPEPAPTPRELMHRPFYNTERKMRYIAREVAMDILEAETIVKNLGIGVEEWDLIVGHPLFRRMLEEERERWGATLNAKERVEVKTWFILEDALEQFQKYLHDANFSDTAKVALFQAMQKQVGIGIREASPLGDVGQRVQVNINLGNDHKLSVEHDVTSQGKVIEHVGAERA
jgi:hypothetical protein